MSDSGVCPYDLVKKLPQKNYLKHHDYHDFHWYRKLFETGVNIDLTPTVHRTNIKKCLAIIKSFRVIIKQKNLQEAIGNSVYRNRDAFFTKQ